MVPLLHKKFRYRNVKTTHKDKFNLCLQISTQMNTMFTYSLVDWHIHWRKKKKIKNRMYLHIRTQEVSSTFWFAKWIPDGQFSPCQSGNGWEVIATRLLGVDFYCVSFFHFKCGRSVLFIDSLAIEPKSHCWHTEVL